LSLGKTYWLLDGLVVTVQSPLIIRWTHGNFVENTGY